MCRVLIMGAGRDFPDVNVCCRDDSDSRVVAFTAVQISNIADCVYPATLADVLAPHLTRWSVR